MILTIRRRVAAALLALAVGLGAVAITSGPADAAPDAPDVPAKVLGHDRDSTASSYDICAWTGVRDGVLGFGSATKLVHYHSFVMIGGEVAVHCKAALYLNGSSFAYCHGWIVDRGTGYTAHLGACQFGAD